MIAVAWDSSNMRAAFVRVDSGLVVCIHDTSSAEAAKNLRESVNGKFAPGELAEDTIGEGDSGIDVSAALARRVDTEHDS